MKKGRRLLRGVRADKEPKVTQSQVARTAGMSEVRYWQIENGERHPATPEEQDAIAKALGVKVSDIAWPVTAKAKAS